MSRHYSTKDFFRQVPSNLLALYFQQQKIFTDLDFSTIKDGMAYGLFSAWLALPDRQRNLMDAQFHEIFNMSCEKGFLAIIDEAKWQLRGMPDDLISFIEKLSSLSNHYERAMVTFLDHNDLWKGATRFYHADTLSYWRKRKNLPNHPTAVDEESIKQLAILIRDYFHNTEGRGKNCTVEPYRRGDLDYFFAFPEDHSQQNSEWIDGEFKHRPHTPAFEIIYVYSQKNGSLDVNYRGSKKAIEPLQSMFATTILKLDELPPDPKDQRIYDLSALANKNFNFVTVPGDGIEKVVVKKLRFSSRITKGDRITLESDPNGDSNAIYKQIDTLNKAIPLLNLYNITQAELTAFVVEGDKPAKQHSIRITYPNSCSLKYDELDLKLRNMLEASKIEPNLLIEI